MATTFTRMDESTAEQWGVIGTESYKNQSRVADRCRAVYLIGAAAEEIARALGGTGVPLHRAERLEQAMAQARREAGGGETVLLSPACASYDQYRDFEARGERFRSLVGELE